ncbi:MAG: hypothetical protein RLY31_339 [Bacteroidota bacterium]|jgi:hypothetical protein
MNNLLLTLALSWFALSALPAQTARQYLRAAAEATGQQNYYAAMKFYQEAIAIQGEVPAVLFEYAETARLLRAYTFADTAYSKVLAGPAAGQYPMARFWLAAVRKKLGRYEAARDDFRQFLATAPPDSLRSIRQATEEIAILDGILSGDRQSDPYVHVERLGNHINTPSSDFAPLLANGSLYYSSLSATRPFQNEQEPRQFSMLQRADLDSRKVEQLPFNDPVRHTAHARFNTDHSRLYYCLCDYVGRSTAVRCEIWYRPILGPDTYGDPVRLPDAVNLGGFTATDPFVGYDTESASDWLLFTSDRPGGQGMLDLWSVLVDEAGQCSIPTNLSSLNTPGNDRAPFFHAPSNALYFSADSREGFGGFDIYQASRMPDGRWSGTRSLPPPVNSSYDDLHFWLNDRRTQGFLASNRLGSLTLEPEFEACCDDIYQFTIDLVDLSVLTFDLRTNQPLTDVRLELLELSDDGEPFPLAVQELPAHVTPFELRKGGRYQVLASKPGFLSQTLDLDLSQPAFRDLRTLERKLYLVPELADLVVSCFNDRTDNPLQAVEVRLVVDGQEVDFRKNPDGHTVRFPLERGRRYEIIGNKIPYIPDTAFVDLTEDRSTALFEVSLRLAPKGIEDFPPLSIYFDNDYPDPRSRSNTTRTAYRETWASYMGRKDQFVREYVRGLTGTDSLFAHRRMEVFFDREVNNGLLSLDAFCENALEVLLDGGFRIELRIQGFTSPRADANYNQSLSERRSDCLRNHFLTWRDGALRPFIENGAISMEVIGYGEKLAPQYISDRLDDERNSIYSVVASSERKVSIIGARKVADKQ